MATARHGKPTGETGLQWVARLKATHPTPASTHLPSLDALIAKTRPAAPDLRDGDTLTLYGRVGAGKSALISYLVLTTIVSPSCLVDGVEIGLGGKGRSVIWIDMDGSFLPSRLASLLLHHIHRCHSIAHLQPDPDTIDEIIDQSLSRISLFRPRSSSALLALLATHIPALLPTLPTLPRLLILDPVNAYSPIDTSPHPPSHDLLATAYRRLHRQLCPISILALRWPYPPYPTLPANLPEEVTRDPIPPWLHRVDALKLWLQPMPNHPAYFTIRPKANPHSDAPFMIFEVAPDGIFDIPSTLSEPPPFSS